MSSVRDRRALACGNLQNRVEILELLTALPSAPVASTDEALSFIEWRQLSGKDIGYIDVHLLASVTLAESGQLWTRDRQLGVVATSLDVAFS